jgi:hypothetical protein
MIKYTLLCDDNHGFEGWFASAAGYDRQLEAGQIKCPSCGTAKVRKAVMTPNIATGKTPTAKAEAKIPGEVLELLRAVRREVVKHADYVGPRFADEARKIHLGEIEARGIYGEATPAEAKALLDEGVQVHPLPKLPEDQN